MKTKPVVPRERAARDADEVLAFYLHEAGDRVALGFINALESAYRQIGRHPASGSLRYAPQTDLPGLRFRMLKGFPYLVFYVDREDHIDVWRVLHAERDIPTRLHESEQK